MNLSKMLLMLVILITFSCSKDSEGESEKQQQGNVSIAFSDGAGFSIENLKATITNQYNTGNTPTITITGTAGNSGTIKISIIDNDNTFKAIVNENSFPIGKTSDSFYATVEYKDDNRSINGLVGKLDIINYSENNAQKYSNLTAVFSTSNTSLNMTSSILDLIIDCSTCK